ncbi:MAG: extracellular solute-binding protein, partial [Acetatifactor sp.]|nr:extracellular solute-binding protein [Acetatifactor sp.]
MKAMLKRWIAISMVMILCVYMLAGCGQDAGSQTETESSGGASENSSSGVPSYMTVDNSGDPTAQRVPVLEGREPYDLFAQPWKGFEEEVAAPVWWNQTVYRENLIQDPPDMTSTEKYRAVEDGDYYILALYDNNRAEEEGIEVLYYLNRIDGDTLETECHQLYLEEMGLSNSLQIAALDVAQGKPVVFAYERDEESQQVSGYYAVWVDQEGHVESSQNLLSALQEAGLVQEDGWLWRNSSKWDSRGYYCVPGIEKGERYAVIDSEGMLAMVLDPTEGLKNPNVSLYHDGQGRCVWEAGEVASESDHVIWCMDEGKQVKLYDGLHPYDGARIINAYGDVYYVNERNALVRWDVSVGSCENLYLGGGASFKGYCALLQNSRGAIVLFYDDGYRDYLFEIANEEVEQVELTLAGYYGIDGITDSLVQEFNRTHEGVQINLKAPASWVEWESNWARVQADLVAGHGPDLLMAPRAQLEPLQKNGLLAELSQIVDQEVQDQIFKGVLEYGMMDGGLYSISHSALAGSYTLIASKELCPTGTWTWEEVVALLEEREQAGRPVRSIHNETSKDYVLTGNSLLCGFFLADLDHCSLLDLENGKASFDTEEFCHLLEVCKRYTQTENSLSDVTGTSTNELAEAGRQQLKDEEILCYQSTFSIFGGFVSFSEDMAGLG